MVGDKPNPRAGSPRPIRSRHSAMSPTWTGRSCAKPPNWVPATRGRRRDRARRRPLDRSPGPPHARRPAVVRAKDTRRPASRSAGGRRKSKRAGTPTRAWIPTNAVIRDAHPDATCMETQARMMDRAIGDGAAAACAVCERLRWFGRGTRSSTSRVRPGASAAAKCSCVPWPRRACCSRCRTGGSVA